MSIDDLARALGHNDQHWRQEFSRVVRERETLLDEVKELTEQAVKDAQTIERLSSVVVAQEQLLAHAMKLLNDASTTVEEATAALDAWDEIRGEP